MDRNKWSLFKKLHRWPGLIISFVLLYYGLTGIFMNHRELFRGIDVERKHLPDNYEYNNWNNAALKGNINISSDSIIVYGNIGVWVTDSSFKKYSPMNQGFPEGSDSRKIFDVHLTQDGNLYSATLFGIFAFDLNKSEWIEIGPIGENIRFTGIESIGDTIFALSRSNLFTGISSGILTKLVQSELPAPEGFEKQVTLFQTLWQIHSGEILGIPGKLFVDLLGIITVFLSVTGIIYFFFPGMIKKRFRKEKPADKLIRVNKWSLKWHNEIGSWTFVLLIILYFSGMFLRPPLLITIGNAWVRPVRWSNLDQPNPWHDKFRDIIYNPENEIFVISTSEGMYYMNRRDKMPVYFRIQPPVSIMGINTLEYSGNGSYLIGSFSGLYLWNPDNSVIHDYIKGTLYTGTSGGRPVGEIKASGTIRDIHNNIYVSDYDIGVIPVHHNSIFPPVPQNVINESKMSLWSLCLEIHTGRFFQGITGIFYILIVPLAGITGITVVISGYLLWRRKYRNKQ